nr:uncharacterized protein LOC117975985 [Pan paniscus]
MLLRSGGLDFAPSLSGRVCQALLPPAPGACSGASGRWKRDVGVILPAADNFFSYVSLQTQSSEVTVSAASAGRTPRWFFTIHPREQRTRAGAHGGLPRVELSGSCGLGFPCRPPGIACVGPALSSGDCTGKSKISVGSCQIRPFFPSGGNGTAGCSGRAAVVAPRRPRPRPPTSRALTPAPPLTWRARRPPAGACRQHDTLLSSPATASFSPDAGGLGCECTEGSHGRRIKLKDRQKSRLLFLNYLKRQRENSHWARGVFCSISKTNKSGK